MLIATAFLGMSVYQNATLEPITASHLMAALEAQNVNAEAAQSAHALLVDLLGPGGAQSAQGSRTHKCLTFDVALEQGERLDCRAFHITVSGMSDARIQGTLCLRPDGTWGEAAGRQGVVSYPLDRRWRDAILHKGAALYGEPGLQSFRGRTDAAETRVQTGGFDYREAQTFAYVRMPGGEARYVLKADLIPAPIEH